MNPLPTRREFIEYEGARPSVVWIIDDVDVWRVHCMDCGIRLGTVNAGNEVGAVRLTRDHERAMHG